jgi:hypothetical protein
VNLHIDLPTSACLFSIHMAPETNTLRVLNVQNVVGRLVEITMHAHDATEAQVDAFRLKLKVAVGNALLSPSKRIAVVADLRGVNVVAPRIADFIVEVMRKDDHYLERSGLLLTPNATFGLQMDRVMREAANAGRRRFDAPEALSLWLGECLSSDETARLATFLHEGPKLSA